MQVEAEELPDQSVDLEDDEDPFESSLSPIQRYAFRNLESKWGDKVKFSNLVEKKIQNISSATMEIENTNISTSTSKSIGNTSTSSNSDGNSNININKMEGSSGQSETINEDKESKLEMELTQLKKNEERLFNQYISNPKSKTKISSANDSIIGDEEEEEDSLFYEVTR
jgi:hypothetical protein